MRIDCKDLDCPEPVLRTKKALEGLGEDAILEVELNTVSSIENCKRFAMNAGCEVRLEEQGDMTLLTIVKGYPCDIVPEKKSATLARSIFVKSDRIGNGELGKQLMLGFLKTTLELDELPANIIFVNEGVLLTTQEEHRDVIDALKALEERGVAIYSCGLCMNYFKIAPEALQVGQIGNAYDTMRMLMSSDVVSL
jgi:selenium metabolism protein YedF